METKAQKAALADILEEINGGANFYLDPVCEIIEEYSLEKGSLNEIYEALMKIRRYDSAAAFAKKFGL